MTVAGDARRLFDELYLLLGETAGQLRGRAAPQHDRDPIGPRQLERMPESFADGQQGDQYEYHARNADDRDQRGFHAQRQRPQVHDRDRDDLSDESHGCRRDRSAARKPVDDAQPRRPHRRQGT